MARTSSLNCFSCRNPYQTPHSPSCLPLYTHTHKKTFLFTEKCCRMPFPKIGSKKLRFQNLVVVAFPTKNRILGDFPLCPQSLLPALLQKLVGDFFFLSLGGKFCGKFGGNFAGIFRTHKKKAPKYRGKFRSISGEKIRASKKIFRANLILQTRHPNNPHCIFIVVSPTLNRCQPQRQCRCMSPLLTCMTRKWQRHI